MIRFACHCTFEFALQDEMAGALIQCPRCGKLNDIPTLGDLANISQDGTYKIEDAPPPESVEKITLAYQGGLNEAARGQIDLRPDYDLINMAGEPSADPLQITAAPKYDPESGELIRPMEVTPLAEPPVEILPVAKAALHYAADQEDHVPTMLTVAAALLWGINLFVLVMILFLHVVLQTVFTVMGIFPFIFLAGVLLVIVLAGHYGNVVDETGPQNRDELPRPMRDVQFYDDIWHPFIQLSQALIISFGPAGLADYFYPQAQWLVTMLLLAGAFIFPAAFLAAVTSGSLNNLRPDRLWSVVRVTGGRYLFLVVVGLVGAYTYYYGWITFTMQWRGMFSRSPSTSVWHSAWFAYSFLALGIYLAHYFCWCLGLAYRSGHEQFNWVLQRYARRNPLDVVGRRAAPRGGYVRPAQQRALAGGAKAARLPSGPAASGGQNDGSGQSR